MLDYYRFQQITELFAQGRSQEGRRLLMELQSRCIALRDEMSTLKAQVQELEDIILLSKSLHFDRQFYWVQISDVRQGPFCPACYDREGTLIRLERRHDRLACPYCGTDYARTAHAVGAETLECPRPQARRIPFAR